jgi:hypothetical protein
LWCHTRNNQEADIMKTALPKGSHRARIVRFADGDTFVALIKLAWGVWVERYVRIEKLESWELHGPDEANAINAARTLTTRFAWQEVILSCSNRRLDRYGRVVASVATQTGDLASQIIEMRLGWPYDQKKRATLPQEPRSPTPAIADTLKIATVAAAATGTGCEAARDASTLVVLTHSGTNPLAVAPHQAATLPSHTILWTLAGVAACALVAGIIWLVHNRGKLVGIAAQVATKL